MIKWLSWVLAILLAFLLIITVEAQEDYSDYTKQLEWFKWIHVYYLDTGQSKNPEFDRDVIAFYDNLVLRLKGMDAPPPLDIKAKWERGEYHK